MPNGPSSAPSASLVDEAVLAAAHDLLAACRARALRVATAESCTGGLIAATLTAFAGSSDVFERGYVTYANAAKTEMVGVPEGLIHAAGAVSEPVARRMADGALRGADVDLAVAVTGIAGPGGGSERKPVGLVWFGVARRGAATHSFSRVFPGDRTEVRRATVEAALGALIEAAKAVPVASHAPKLVR